MKLSIKIPLLLGMVVLASAVAMLIAVGLKVRGTIEKSCLDSLGSEADANADFLKSKLDGQLEVLAEIATRVRVRSMDWSVVQPALKADVARLGALDLAMVNSDGLAHYVLDNTTLDVNDRAYFKKAMAGEKNVETIVSRTNDKVAALFAVPIRKTEDMNSPIVGVLIARKDGAQTLSNLVTELKTSYESGHAFLINSEGTVIAHKNQELVNRQFNPIKEVEKDPSLKSLASAITLATQKKKGKSDYSYNGKNLIGAYSEVRGFSWVLLLNIEKHEIEKELSQISMVMIWIGLICLIAGIIAAIGVGRSIAKPVIRMVDALKDITQGEGDLTQSISVHSKDEMGDLARYFNKLVATLREPISEAKATVVHLVTVSEELSSVSRQLAGGSEETVSQSNAVANIAEHMAVNINAMASGAEEASMNANEVAGAADHMSMNMNTIAAAIEEMSASISEISNNAGEANKVAHEATAKSYDATSVMNRLGLAAKEIGHVTNVIKKIADKTNLLALNATIEAASAGEAGKGFAVVASEIKELANQSALSADDIAQRINGIQVGTDEAVAVIRDVSDIIAKINNSVEAISVHVGEQTKASNEIANNVAQANSGAKRVATAVSEVARGANDVSKNAGEAAKGAHNVSSNVVVMSQSAKESSNEVLRVSRSAEELSKMAGQLRQAMDKFKV
ncbi:MAG: methyl-accepting chemotaxis protein [Fibromonadaceae bacterium]|jgi:methyl-accepting chemotaxis protein|nr:methyl-accepting chemotaxis protein [Fibromonadaceae bacterium]